MLTINIENDQIYQLMFQQETAAPHYALTVRNLTLLTRRFMTNNYK